MKTELFITFADSYGDSQRVEAPIHIPQVGDYVKNRYEEYKVTRVIHEFDADGHTIYVKTEYR